MTDITTDSSTESIATTSQEQKPKTASAGSSSSSWEDIANEVVPMDVTSGGLATGAMRGPSRPYPGGPSRSGVTFIPAPVAPKVIQYSSSAPGAAFDEVLRGKEVAGSKLGKHYLISHPVTAYDDEFALLSDRLRQALKAATHPALSEAKVEDLLFVDIETTGLASDAPLFLIGALRLDGEPHMNMFLARSYREEGAVLEAFHALARKKVLITYNGKSFDWPYIERRSRAHRVSCTTPRSHFDLLHHARRTWKHVVPDCKLQTLELYLCARTRHNDVPSSRIPERYQEFMELYAMSGRGAHLLAPVIHHNALDVLTTAQLFYLSYEKNDKKDRAGQTHSKVTNI